MDHLQTKKTVGLLQKDKSHCSFSLRFIKIYTKDRFLHIIDACSGAGSCALACSTLERKCIILEKSLVNARLIRQRVNCSELSYSCLNIHFITWYTMYCRLSSLNLTWFNSTFRRPIFSTHVRIALYCNMFKLVNMQSSKCWRLYFNPDIGLSFNNMTLDISKTNIFQPCYNYIVLQ